MTVVEETFLIKITNDIIDSLEILTMWSKLTRAKLLMVIGVCVTLSTTGCQSSIAPQDLIAAQDVLNSSCCKPDTTQQINFLALRQTPPQEYTLGKGDTLGIYIQGITGDKDTPPPVNFPDDPGAQPGLGYPVPVRDDGYISLPLISPIRVTGLTLSEAERRISDAYTKDKEILLEGSEKIIVTLMKRRTYNVLVIREDVQTSSSSTIRTNETFIGNEVRSETFSIELPATENDVLHALSETGGLPSERAKNEIVIFRGGQNRDVNSLVQEIGAPGAPAQGPQRSSADIIRIPIEAERGNFPNFSEADITLYDGDVVYIEGREQDVFYTGGLLPGGRYPLPRDYQIDVLEAIAISGGSESTTAGAGSLRNGILPATQVTVLRKCGCEQVAIDVDLRYALADPSERVIVQSGDLIILEFRKRELITNSLFGILQFGGIFNVFR